VVEFASVAFAALPPGGTFIDDDGHIFEGAIEAIAAEGITKGCNPPVNDKFCPNDKVTRGEMAVFLVRAMGYKDNGGGNLFIDDDGLFYENAADKLGVLAFAIFQDTEVLRDKKGSKQVKSNHTYQVTISEIQNWTGIKFGDRLYNANPLFYRNIASNRRHANSLPERIPVTPANAIVSDSAGRRPDVTHLASRLIVITSAMINPKGSESTGEWVSLLNRGNRKTKVNNWRLIDGHGREAIVTGSIESGGAMRLKGRTLGKVKLNNSEGSLSLLDNHKCLIDYVSWSKPQIKRVAEGTAFLFDNQNN
ncbi:MAG: S-layer homology domain-containing protein, partial [Proteobacteria bacterium]|nr:S-layer homology domain-containing protein [Pseudomonadota bacterium]